MSTENVEAGRSLRDGIDVGQTFTAAYPFVLEDYTEHDHDGPSTRKSWRPGVRFEERGGGPYKEPETYAIADGLGEQILTVVSIHKPGRYPERIFFTRRWRDPNGKAFGRGALRVGVRSAFKTLVRGYRHEFEMADFVAPDRPSRLQESRDQLMSLLVANGDPTASPPAEPVT